MKRDAMNRIHPLFPFLVLLLSACSANGHQLTSGQIPASPVQPWVVQSQGGDRWLTFSVPTANAGVSGIAGGFDGAVWFTEGNQQKVGRIDMSGNIVEYPISAHIGAPGAITGKRNGDGAFFESLGYQIPNAISHISETGSERDYRFPTGYRADNLLEGPDGRVWFTGSCPSSPACVGVLTPGSGVYSTYDVPSATGFAYDLVFGPDGNIWFNVPGGNVVGVGKVTPAGVLTFYPAPTSFLTGLAAGSDGSIWFSGYDQMFSLNPATGVMTSHPLSQPTKAESMVQGPDDVLYFLPAFATLTYQIGRYDISTNTLLTPKKRNRAYFAAMAMGPDGNLWLAGGYKANAIDAFILQTLTTSVSSMTLTVGGTESFSAKENEFRGRLQASSTNPAIAAVAAGPTKNSFVVTGASAGSCDIVVGDGRGNTIDVAVTVQ